MKNNRRKKIVQYNGENLGEHLSSVDMEMELLRVERGMSLDKALTSNNPVDFIRASREINNMQQRMNGNEDGKAFLYDPMADTGLGYREKPVVDLSYTTLRRMARTPVLKGIIGTRQSQILNFSKFSEDAMREGWQIRRKPQLFEEETDLTDAEKKEITEIAEFLINSGSTSNKWHADSFDKILTKMMKDSLEIDQVGMEIIRNNKGEITEFYMVDGATLRYSANYYDPTSVDEKFLIDGNPPIYAQIYQGRVHAEFYPWELMFGVRNLSTDIYANGYGVSETEDLFRVITWMLNADTYNGKFFTNGSLPRGFFKVMSKVPQKTLNSLRSRWSAMARGVENAHKTPFMEGDVDWVDMHLTNNDMQFHQWMEYLIRVASAVFKIDPTEIGFLQSAGGAQRMSHKQRTDHSQDKGLYPLLYNIQHWFNRWLISEINPKYEFVFTGIVSEDEGDNIKNDKDRIGNWSTVDEIRQKNGLEPIGKENGGDLILNSNYMQFIQMQQMGGEESNDYVDEEYGDEEYGRPQDTDEGENNLSPDYGGGTEEDQFQKSLKDWIEKGMPVTELVQNL
jgi:hypothetical protein